MKSPVETIPNRREFLGRFLPACGLLCLGLKALPLRGQSAAAQSASGHKFDEELSQKLSFRRLFRIQYGPAHIPFLKHCVKDLGREKTIEMLKAFSVENGVAAAQDTARRLGKNDFETLKSFFSPSNPVYSKTLTFSVAESTDKVHELHVTECLWASTFLEAQAGDLGYAEVCFGDYQFAKSFNPEIEMVRTKTLMQGDACCNHRYLWKR
jgi:hypothetical protein